MLCSTGIQKIRDTMARIGVPTSITSTSQGTALIFQQGLDNQPWLILAALITVYIVLGILYESYVHPITILSTLPSAGVGALLALLAAGSEFSIIAFIGVILLIGIVKKNAILMIDFAILTERIGDADAQSIQSRYGELPERGDCADCVAVERTNCGWFVGAQAQCDGGVGAGAGWWVECDGSGGGEVVFLMRFGVIRI